MNKSAIEPSGSDTGTPLTIAKRLKLVNQHVPLRGLRVLDAGCGAGSYVAAMTAYGADVLGIEYHAHKVDEYRIRHALNNVLVGDIENLQFKDGSFDLVFSNEVLEHVSDDSAALREIWRVLQAGGRLCLFVPNRLYPLETHGCHTLSGIRLSSLVPFIPWIPDRLASKFLRFSNRNYWRSDIVSLLIDSGFDIEHIQTVWQTLSNSSGKIPHSVMFLATAIRPLMSLAERTLILNRFGISHFVVCRKPVHSMNHLSLQAQSTLRSCNVQLTKE